MNVRQRVSSILEDESFIVVRIETQFGNLNGVKDVVGGIERVKFLPSYSFSCASKLSESLGGERSFYNVFLYALDVFL